MLRKIWALVKLFFRTSYAFLFVTVPYLVFGFVIPFILTIIPDELSNWAGLPDPDGGSDWAHGKMWIFMFAYLFISYLFTKISDVGDGADANNDLTALGILALLMLPGCLFLVSIWPVLVKLKLVKTENEDVTSADSN